MHCPVSGLFYFCPCSLPPSPAVILAAVCWCETDLAGAPSTPSQHGPPRQPPPSAPLAASCNACALSCSPVRLCVPCAKPLAASPWPPSVTTLSHWPKVVPTINRTSRVCATRVMRPRARPNACAACAGHGSELRGEGEVKSLAPATGNRPVPHFFTCAGFGGGVLPGRA